MVCLSCGSRAISGARGRTLRRSRRRYAEGARSVHPLGATTRMVRDSFRGATCGGSHTGNVRFTSGASCDASVCDGESGKTSSCASCRARPFERARHRVVGRATRQIAAEVHLLVDLDGRKPGSDQVILHPLRPRSGLGQVGPHPEGVVARRSLLALEIGASVGTEGDGPRRVDAVVVRGARRQLHDLGRAVHTQRHGASVHRRQRPEARLRARRVEVCPRRPGPGRNAMPWSKSGIAAPRARRIDGCPVRRVCTMTSCASIPVALSSVMSRRALSSQSPSRRARSCCGRFGSHHSPLT